MPDQLEPGRWPPGLVGVSLIGPTLMWSIGVPSPDGLVGRRDLLLRWVESPSRWLGPMISRASAGDMSSWPMWTPSARTDIASSGRR